MFDDCRYFMLTGANAKATPSMWAAALKCLDICLKRGISVVFDPNLRAELHTKNLYEAWAPVLEQTSIFLGSEPEIIAFSNKANLADALAADTFARMDIIVLKAGKQGARIISADRDLFIEPYFIPDEKEVDPTGAGDCWAGAFIAMLAKGADLAVAGDCANAAGAVCVTRTGSMGCATLEEIEALRNARPGK
jgi:sugar/nucleoside kinase (ribokinase family)